MSLRSILRGFRLWWGLRHHEVRLGSRQRIRERGTAREMISFPVYRTTVDGEKIEALSLEELLRKIREKKVEKKLVPPAGV